MRNGKWEVRNGKWEVRNEKWEVKGEKRCGHMKLIKISILLFVIGLVISACSSPIMDSSERIVSPKNQLIPIKGTWEISEVLIAGASDAEGGKEWLGKRIQFSNLHISMEEPILENPQYQMKRVSGEQYLLFNFKSLPANFVFPNKEVEVITVMDGDKFFCEVLIIKENKLILKIQGNSFYLDKVSDEVDEYINRENNIEDDRDIDIQKDRQDACRTGVLIGLRSLNENNDEDFMEEYNYRTLWISLIDGEMRPVLEMENIFFPRRSGFWKIQMKNTTKDGRTEEYVSANNILMEDKKTEIQQENRVMDIKMSFIKGEPVQEIDFSGWGERLGEIRRKINYVGNDYISVETTGKGVYIIGNRTWEKSKLQLLLIDGLPNGQGVKISDILSDTGVSSIESAWEKAVDHLGIDDFSILYPEELLENFGLERKLGRWFIEGRINYIKNGEFNISDYSISLIPPPEVVSYNTLSVPWTNVKDKVPRALDVYTSPNKDIAVVFTKSELLIYNIHGNELSSYPREKLKLEKGEIAIMAEWATGQYVESWENTFKTVMGD
ncbi:MAG: hypothetical protein M0P14_02900 [Alkaliphilus sp.]|nr:hypothetical protein [Alkaliphilus sp.]